MHNRLAAFVPVLALVLLLCACGGKAAESPALEIVCLDVGQGNSTLLRTGAGDVLIDAGPEAAQEALVRRLHALGVESLALVILTHVAPEKSLRAALAELATLSINQSPVKLMRIEDI